jgi:ketosteroid isomerase-like protein
MVTAAFAALTAGDQTFFDEIQAQNLVWTIKGGGPSAGIYRGRQDLIERAINPLSARPASPIRPTVHNLWAEGKRHHLLGWGDNDQRWQAVSQQLCVDLQNARWTGSTGDGISGFGGV